MPAADAFALGLLAGALLWPLGLLVAWLLLRGRVAAALAQVLG